MQLVFLFLVLFLATAWSTRRHTHTASPAPPGAGLANHLTLTVHGLETEDCPSGIWLVDVGLGDALHAPIPLREGTYVQGPFRYQLRRSEVEPGGWRLDHDPIGSFAGMDFRVHPATVDEFTKRHLYLSTSPDSGFVRTCCVMRRDATGIDILRGCVLGRIGTQSDQRTLETQAEWFEALADVFGLRLVDVDATARNVLWKRVRQAHEAWLVSWKEAGANRQVERPCKRQRGNKRPVAAIYHQRRAEMAEQEPVAEQLLSNSDQATPTPWTEARRRLAEADWYWLATVRPDGRPHVMPLLAVWLDGALYFCTGATTRKGKNLARKAYCVITVGSDDAHLVVEGEAAKVSGEATLRRVAEVYASKYGWQVAVRNGAFYADGAPTAGPPPYDVYAVFPTLVFGLGTDESFSPTRWHF